MSAAISTGLWLAIVGIMVQLYGIPSSDAFSPGDGVCSGGNTGASSLISLIHRLDTKIQQETLNVKTTVLSFDTKLSTAFFSLISISTSLKQVVTNLEVNIINDIRSLSSSSLHHFTQILTSITAMSSSVTRLHNLLTITQNVKTEVTNIQHWISQTSVTVTSSTVDITNVKVRVDQIQIRLQALIQILVKLSSYDVTVKNTLVVITSKMTILKTSLTTTSTLLSTQLVKLSSTQTLLTSVTNKASVAVSSHTQSLTTLASSISSLSSKMTSSFSIFIGSVSSSVSKLSTSSSSVSTSITSISSFANQAQTCVTSVSQGLAGCGLKLNTLTSSINALSVQATTMSSTMSSLQLSLFTSSQTATSVNTSMTQMTSTQSTRLASASTQLTQLQSRLSLFSSLMSTSFTSLTTKISTCKSSVTSLSVLVAANTALLQKLTLSITEIKISLTAILTVIIDIIGTGKCAITCTNIGPQVCGIDGVTYINNCYLRKAACFALDKNIIITKKHDGACVIVVDPCKQLNGGCAQICSSVGSVVKCSCLTGYKLNANGLTCDVADPCKQLNGGCAQICSSVGSLVTCSCLTGYKLNANGRTCDVVDPCKQLNGGCAQICSSVGSVVICSCLTGYKLDANGRTCNVVVTDPCKVLNGGCAQICSSIGSVAKCSCISGYTLNTNGRSCDVTGCVSGSGVRYNNGDSWKEDRCTTCQCQNQNPICIAQSCAPVVCANPQFLPGQCCPICQVNGGWSAWSTFGVCSVTCGNGVQSRSRSCTNPAPLGGGALCAGASTNSQVCNPGACPVIVNGGWSAWSTFGICSVTCGNGVQSRSRTCTNPAPQGGGAICAGASAEGQVCNPGACPVIVNGGWSAWSIFGVCSVTCGNGVQSRSRTCTNPAPQGGGAICAGASAEGQVCNPGACPVNGGWSAWSIFGVCSVTCGNGVQSRSRTCTNPAPQGGGAICAGASAEGQVCNPGACPVNGGWSAWSIFGVCSVTCGNGVQSRSRTCTNPAPQGGGAICAGASTNSQVCNQGACPVTPSCPLKFDMISGRCYYIKLPSGVLDPTDANTACTGLGAKLVAFQTLAEFHAVQAKVRSLMKGVHYKKNFWTAGREMGPTRYSIAWVWANTREPININVWATAEPNSHGTCAAMYGYHDYKLTDVSCKRSDLKEDYGYVCET